MRARPITIGVAAAAATIGLTVPAVAVAAHLAAGEPLAGAGDPLAVDELVALELPRPREEDGTLVVQVKKVRFARSRW